MSDSNKIRIPQRPAASCGDPVADLKSFLGAAVFIAWPRGVKGSARRWSHLRISDMTPGYFSKLSAGNIGVALGEVSGGLCAIDLDADELVSTFIEANPILSKTFSTHGSRGRVFWFRVKGTCPRSCKLKDSSGEGIGEFRAGGNQSIVWGIHPTTKQPYKWLVRSPVVEIAIPHIHWPESMSNPFAPDGFAGQFPRQGVYRDGDPLSDAPVCLCAAGAAGASLRPLVLEKMERAVDLGAKAGRGNNSAAFEAALALLRLLGVPSLNEFLTPTEKIHFAVRWFDRLKADNRISAGKSKSHYMNDIITAMKNIRPDAQSKNPVLQAWTLAQSNPLPPEAAIFAGDDVMQKLIALCFQLHQLANGGEWFLGRDTAARLFGLDATATRNLSENFSVLVGCGILEIITPFEKGTRQATIYRFIERMPQ